MWPAVLDVVKTLRPGRLDAVQRVDADLLRATATSPSPSRDAGKANNIKASGHDERLRQAVLDVMKTDVRIDVVLAPDRVVPARAPADAAAPDASPPAAEPDAPSIDDPNATDAVGVDLALRELGATRIGEIDH